MPSIPKDFRPYFDALAYGLAELLPPYRVKNTAFLLMLHDAVQVEPALTVYDTEHLKRIMAMTDTVIFPPITDVKTCCEAEAFLIRACPKFCKKEVRLTLKWAFLLLARHGQVKAELAKVEVWFRAWRIVQSFHAIEQGFLSDFIRWLTDKRFSPRSILDTLREYRKFKSWMLDHDVASLEQVGNVEVQRYLLSRAFEQSNGSKQKILGGLRPVFYYYQEAIHGGFVVPDFTVKAPRALGVNSSASSQEINQLWAAIEARKLPAMAALMLVLIMGYGLPLKALPLLRLTGQVGILTYTEQLPCRRGLKERIIVINFSLPWLSELWHVWLEERETGASDYLFTSGHGQRRNRPASVEHCQQQVKAFVTTVLGYPIPVNHLERGAFKQLARQKPLTEFMCLTAEAPKSRLTRMMTWLCQQSG